MYSELNQTYKIELFSKIVNGWKFLNIFEEKSILNAWLGYECASETLSSSTIFRASIHCNIIDLGQCKI